MLLVAVSGGPDSSALAHMLIKQHFNITLASFDHQLRPGSAQDCHFVQHMAEQFDVPFFTGKADIHHLAEQQKLSLEDAARQARYGFLFTTAQTIQSRAVLTAHTADDQVETVLMHILRGSGTRGLTGMAACAISAFHPTIPLVRPLLGVWRTQIEEYCRQYELQTRVDESNEDQGYFRNRIRHSLIPALQSYNPSVQQNLLNLSEIVKEDWDFLENQYQQLYDTFHTSEGEGYVSFSLEKFRSLKNGAQKALIRRGMQTLAPAETQIEHSTVLRVLHFTQHPNRAGHMDLPAGLHAFIARDKFYLSRLAVLPLTQTYPQCRQAFDVKVEDMKNYPLQDGGELLVEVVPLTAYQPPRTSAGLLWEAYFDLKALPTHILNVRAYRSGDRFQPLGMQGRSVKLSDLFINKKIPVQVREHWLVVENGNAIVWVAGFQPAHFTRMQPDTRRLLHLQVKF